ncbi:hypothetical protein B0H15DRAFT_582206 [Mycena belliarum]|uniref:Uncharacterized protein n=1 Tax=Mycena belliarum TaxID=1033014 RepID=A0AAD6XTI8_9AGAR|nr:hypothetical protein B0H15DRAFT_582206 [Mycena belliae]
MLLRGMLLRGMLLRRLLLQRTTRRARLLRLLLRSGRVVRARLGVSLRDPLCRAIVLLLLVWRILLLVEMRIRVVVGRCGLERIRVVRHCEPESRRYQWRWNEGKRKGRNEGSKAGRTTAEGVGGRWTQRSDLVKSLFWKTLSHTAYPSTPQDLHPKTLFPWILCSGYNLHPQECERSRTMQICGAVPRSRYVLPQLCCGPI